MKKCWQNEPNNRPDFKTLSLQLKELLNETHLKVTIDV